MDRNVAFALIVAASLTGLLASSLIEAPSEGASAAPSPAAQVERPQYKPNDIRYRFQQEEERKKRRATRTGETSAPAPGTAHQDSPASSD